MACWRAALRIACLVALLLPGSLLAAVVASIDRSDIELNESFTLKVTVDTSVDTEPDASALEEDFYLLSRSQLSNTTIVNGQISRSRTWTYSLMAKKAGRQVIPPISVGREQSQPLTITVAPQRVAVPGEADVFVASEVDRQESYVQAQVLYRVKVYRAVSTRQPRLSEPEFDGVEVLVEIAADERSYESLIDGKSYTVNERVYALFPQASGEIDIAPARFEARVLKDGRISGRKIFQSEPVTVTVKPIPPPPEEFPGAAWLPAKSVELSEEWSREPDRLPAGEPITRHVTITALGQLSTQIPAIEPVESEALKVYPDKPELTLDAHPEGLLAKRKDQYAMIGVAEGEVRIPELELPWWNLDSETWEVARLPGRTLTMLPSADALPPPMASEERLRAPAEHSSTVVVQSKFWRRVSETLAALWLLTLIAWWRSGRRRRRPAAESPPVVPPAHRQHAKLLKAARRAAQAGDAAATRSALLDWARLQWPEDTPRSVGELGERLGGRLADELERLSRVSYGPGEPRWDGQALADALRRPRAQPADASQNGALLPPLMPRG